MRVSWCQRLDGRMLSTFSMMKLSGANSVLRNWKYTSGDFTRKIDNMKERKKAYIYSTKKKIYIF